MATILLIVVIFWSLMNMMNMPSKEHFESVRELEEKSQKAIESWNKAEKLSKIIGTHEAIQLWKESKDKSIGAKEDHRTAPFAWMKEWIHAYIKANPYGKGAGLDIIKWIDSHPKEESNEI
jgi:hypothetical protein